MKKIWFLIALLSSVLLFFLPLCLQAGITGKIRGFVRDEVTGNPLPGANVFISHVWGEGGAMEFSGALGAATDTNGEFVILQVPPGKYSITVTTIGYSRKVLQNVRVNVDRTSRIEFLMKEEVLDLGAEVIVEAKRDLIQLDVASTENYITAEEYQTTPFANRVEDVIKLQSGISGNINEGEIKIREGETMEVGFLLDGMDMFDQKFNRPVISIQPGVVQEIKIMRNGFNAEYGQSRSGVINVITKNPADRFHFSFDYQLTPAHRPHYGRDKYDQNWRTEWILMDGSRAFEGDTIYVPDGIHETPVVWRGWNEYSEELLSDNNPDNDLTAQEAYELWKWRHRPMPYDDKHGHNIDLSLSGRIPLLPWKANLLLGGKYEYRPFDYPQSRDAYDDRISSLKVVNMLNPNMKLILNSMYSEVRSVTEGEATSSWGHEDRISYEGDDFRGKYMYYPFYKPLLNRYASVFGTKFLHTISPTLYYEINLNHFYVKWNLSRPEIAGAEDGRYFHERLYLDPQSGWIPKELGADDTASPSYFKMHGGALTWDDSYDRRTTLNVMMTNQFHPSHELKAGFEFVYDDLREDRNHWHNEDSTQAFTQDFHVYPLEIAAYVQDKIEFKGMVANVGVRIDYFNVNSDRPDPHRALEYASDREIHEAYVTGNYPTFRPKAKYYVSPRVGISHPLSSRSKLYFNYGHFIQTAVSEVLYHTMADWSRPRMTFMGNADIDFPTTISYELGCDIGLSDFFQLHVGAFYKDYHDFESGMVYAHSDQSLVMEWYDQNNYKEIRGIEIEIRKTVGRFITGWLNYNYIKKSEANLEIPNLSQIPIITDDPSVGRNGVLWGVPRSNIILVQPDARGVITFSAPRDWGPKLKDYSLLGNTHLSFQVFYKGGRQDDDVQHPSESFRNANPDVRFKEKEKYWADMRISRLFRLNQFTFELYMDVSNILHSKFRNIPGGKSKEDYYDDLWNSGRIDQLGTDELSNPEILRTWSDDVYWAKKKIYVFGLRMNL